MKSGNRITLSLLAAASLALAQDAPTAPPNAGTPAGGWTRVGESGAGNLGSGQLDPQAGQAPNQPSAPIPNPAPPERLNLRAGTYITVRVNQALSSDKNQPGDGFTASLVRPVIVDGFVVAEPGQTIGGRVAEAKKAGHGSAASHLGLQLTDLTLADGQQVPIHSDLVANTPPRPVGPGGVAAVGTTTVVGAGVGAVAAGGTGAAVGAGVGAVASTIGVLLTRGRPTIITPESVLTFKIDSDVTIATDKAPQAFHPVGPNDYRQNAQPQLQAGRPGPPPPGYAAYPYGYPYGYGYGYPYYPYWGSGVGLYFGGVGFYGPRIGFGVRGRFR